MNKHFAVTSISAPNPTLCALAEASVRHDFQFSIIGDTKSPAHFELEGSDFIPLDAQKKLPFRLAALLPERSYARKNLGYLRAIRDGADFILETDDDNFPLEDFWTTREPMVAGSMISQEGWMNVYSWFSSETIWPRGFPLECLARETSTDVRNTAVACPIQQGLADGNPDVDAVYRMTRPLPVTFERREPVILDRQTWCPYNSQNTLHFSQAFQLMYLPSYCSFRMTDIWRGFVAQRILWTCGWHLSFQHATVRQERNARIVKALAALPLADGPAAIGDNLLLCYRKLAELGVLGEQEIPLVEAWLADCKGS